LSSALALQNCQLNAPLPCLLSVVSQAWLQQHLVELRPAAMRRMKSKQNNPITTIIPAPAIQKTRVISGLRK
jgi:hypothetical protein